MTNAYYNMATKQLKTLRSKKYNRITRLEHLPMGYFNIQEVRVLRQQLIWIDAVLEQRELQMSFM